MSKNISKRIENVMEVPKHLIENIDLRDYESPAIRKRGLSKLNTEPDNKEIPRRQS